jgi:hypothetical protein
MAGKTLSGSAFVGNMANLANTGDVVMDSSSTSPLFLGWEGGFAYARRALVVGIHFQGIAADLQRPPFRCLPARVCICHLLFNTTKIENSATTVSWILSRQGRRTLAARRQAVPHDRG